MMKIARVSPITHELREREFDITADQYRRWLNGELIQNVMPELSDEEREFIISGCSSDEWDFLFPEEQK